MGNAVELMTAAVLNFLNKVIIIKTTTVSSSSSIGCRIVVVVVAAAIGVIFDYV